jgi:hypothetical protein
VACCSDDGKMITPNESGPSSETKRDRFTFPCQ